ncbi:MAG: phosphoenolpyruvate--protein phosphotransferase [Betaproteobacteria bacterium RBG_16_64_18]|nr:MAG: phosphoenolpyruvate--protein phosphotransferase [Betaproteobacteria bacterium RBG_16_64_18]OGA11890.1 MAG: phosphoenolpyruvate--protein phosphotransferase [Betaproteobacteria bacterium RIFCSPLOWO2_02_FULL_65_20]OGA39105.1 MAG: phosphoenolpyruvate--protein phosphotransferase [Betaproteobacteria bacterium RIFCSPLOWO2_12_FULL_65_110]
MRLPQSGAGFTLHGAGVSGGIAIGYAHLVSAARLEVAHYDIAPEAIEEEVSRFDDAIAEVRGELIGLQANVSATAPAEMSAFLNLNLMILDDAQLSRVPRELIRSRGCNAEWALTQQMELLAQQFEQIEDAYLRERKNDIVQVVERVLKAMLGTGHAPAAPSHEENVIVVAHDLSPADMILFKQHQFAGFATDLGGVTSHTAIVARSLNIPAIVGLHHARGLIRENELLIVDGREGVLIVNPDRQVLAEFRLRQGQLDIERQKLKSLRSTPSTTLDGVAIELQANIELPQDVHAAIEAGAAGIGLFRSEFVFLNRDDLPSEDEQFEAYRKVAEAMDGRPVTIRTLDLGADKTVNGADRAGPNPALGLRAIRFCLAEPQMFLAQLRAILRSSIHGKVRILVPMLAHVHEIEQAMTAIAQAKEQLDDLGVPYDHGIKVGGMIEIPAAALSLGIFVKKLDFLSIGTNDLTQYTLAIDRSDDAVAHLYDPLHPAVLHLIAQTIRVGEKAGRPVAVCGEMAGDLAATRLLLAFGLREFSMHPAQLLTIKQQVLRTNMSQARGIASRILRSDDPAKCLQLLGRLND